MYTNFHNHKVRSISKLSNLLRELPGYIKDFITGYIARKQNLSRTDACRPQNMYILWKGQSATWFSSKPKEHPLQPEVNNSGLPLPIVTIQKTNSEQLCLAPHEPKSQDLTKKYFVQAKPSQKLLQLCKNKFINPTIFL